LYRVYTIDAQRIFAWFLSAAVLTDILESFIWQQVDKILRILGMKTYKRIWIIGFDNKIIDEFEKVMAMTVSFLRNHTTYNMYALHK